MIDLTPYDVRAAVEVVSRIAVRTPVIESQALSRRIGATVWLKLENLQVTGSFKVRGAANRMTALSEAEKQRGVVTCSSGNHGRAVAYVGEALGVVATVCVPEWVDITKLDAIRAHGAEPVLYGKTYDEAEARSLEIQRERGLAYVHPFDDPHVIAGQGTIGLELLDQVAACGAVVVPLSGGGLIAGIAAGIKSVNRKVRIIAVSAANARVMYESVQAGKPTVMPEEETVANALAGGIGTANRHSFALVCELVDEHVLVSEGEIRDAMRFAAREHKLIVEGGGAVGLAALLHDRVTGGGGDMAVIVSGGNVDGRVIADVLTGP